MTQRTILSIDESMNSENKSSRAVLHLLGGLNFKGGLAVVVNELTNNSERYQARVWMHRRIETSSAVIVRGGLAPSGFRGARQDVFWAAIEFIFLFIYLLCSRPTLVHAHSRVGLYVGWLACTLLRIPLILHFHVNLHHRKLYQTLARTSAATIFTSHSTQRHFHLQTQPQWVCEPVISWPHHRLPKQNSFRIIGCGTLFPSKNHRLMIESYLLWQSSHSSAVELHLFGDDPKVCQPEYADEIRAMCKRTVGVYLHPYNSNWKSLICANDIFLHIPESEAFGIVMLEAFALGLKMVIGQSTFLDELPSPLNHQGIFRCSHLRAIAVSQSLSEASEAVINSKQLHTERMSIAPYFSIQQRITDLEKFYDSILEDKK